MADVVAHLERIRYPGVNERQLKILGYLYLLPNRRIEEIHAGIACGRTAEFVDEGVIGRDVRDLIRMGKIMKDDSDVGVCTYSLVSRTTT